MHCRWINNHRVVSKVSEIQRRHVSHALSPRNKVDEQVARLEDFFDASWEISSPISESLDDISSTPSVGHDGETDDLPTIESTSDQFVQVQRFKDVGFHQVNEYSRRQSMKLKSILSQMIVNSSAEKDKEGAGEISGSDPKQGENSGFVEKLTKDVVQLSSSTVDTISKKTDKIVSIGRQQVTTVKSYTTDLSKKHPLVFDCVSLGLGLYFSLVAFDAVKGWIARKSKSKLDSQKQLDRHRKKGQRQKKRFQNMLGSFDEGVDTSVFNAVRQIGENAAGYDDTDVEATEEVEDRDTMTKEMKAAWKNFVKDSKLSEGEFWTQDNIDQGLQEIEIEFEQEQEQDSIDDDVDVDADDE